MTTFGVLTARLAVIDRANVDTDQIIPARFLRKPRSAGYDTFLFHDLPEVRAAVLGAGVVLAGPNFGCGSSREGAVYALVDAGVRCVIAPSFGDIFAGNAGKNGLLLLNLPAAETSGLVGSASVTVDLPGQFVRSETVRGETVQGGAVQGGATLAFEIDPFRKRMLVEGLDDIGLTLAHAGDIDAWSVSDAVARPWAVPGQR